MNSSDKTALVVAVGAALLVTSVGVYLALPKRSGRPKSKKRASNEEVWEPVSWKTKMLNVLLIVGLNIWCIDDWFASVCEKTKNSWKFKKWRLVSNN